MDLVKIISKSLNKLTTAFNKNRAGNSLHFDVFLTFLFARSRIISLKQTEGRFK